MDPISLAVGAGILAVGLLAGRFVRLRARPAAAEPICGCSHHRAKHDPATSQCYAIVNIAPRGYSANLQQCACRQYVGPEPPLDYLSAVRMLEDGER